MGLILLPGTCRECGCTDTHACDGGCSWVDAEHTLCSACAPEEVPFEEFDESEPGIGWDTP